MAFLHTCSSGVEISSLAVLKGTPVLDRRHWVVQLGYLASTTVIKSSSDRSSGNPRTIPMRSFAVGGIVFYTMEPRKVAVSQCFYYIRDDTGVCELGLPVLCLYRLIRSINTGTNCCEMARLMTSWFRDLAVSRERPDSTIHFSQLNFW